MQRLAQMSPWINRLVLAAVTFIFTMIGMRFIGDPAPVAAQAGITLHTGLAATMLRVGFGAFPLSFAAFSFWCLLSRDRLRTGVSLVATLITMVIAVRLISTLWDGAPPQSTRLLAPEGAILLLSLTGLLAKTPRSRSTSGGTI